MSKIVIPFILKYGYGLEKPVPTMMLTIALGEIVSCGVLGLILYRVLYPHKEKLFGYEQEEKK